MKKLAFLMLFVLNCGSEFIENPGPHPDFTNCYKLEKQLWGTTPWTPVKLPILAGSRSASLYTEKPDHWEVFEGSIHLTKMTWNIDWMSKGSINVDGLTIAKIEDGEWTTFPNVDIYPHLRVTNEDWLKFDATMKAEGWKPRGEQAIEAFVTVQLCGINAELIVVQYDN